MGKITSDSDSPTPITPKRISNEVGLKFKSEGKKLKIELCAIAAIGVGFLPNKLQIRVYDPDYAYKDTLQCWATTQKKSEGKRVGKVSETKIVRENEGEILGATSPTPTLPFECREVKGKG